MTDQTPAVQGHEPGGYAALSSHLQAASGGATQLVDLLTDGLLVDRQLGQVAGRIPRQPGSDRGEQ